ncbi:MAG: aldo/keto reductase [Candidatus Hadarchaeales archaeon]
METIALKDGNRMPALGLGTWQLTGPLCTKVVRRALELGYRHVDTAEIYGNQREVGEALKGFERSEIFVTSKVWTNHLHYEETLKACERTLEELDTDYLDLYLIHWPSEEVPVRETLEAMEELKKRGAVRSVGVSNFGIRELREALKVAGDLVVNNQIEFHPYLYQKEVLEFCRKHEISVTAYSPLGRKVVLQDPVVLEIARRHRKTPAQVCLRWALQKGAAVIPKASTEQHLRENLQVFGWELPEDDIARLDSLNRGKSVL